MAGHFNRDIPARLGSEEASVGWDHGVDGLENALCAAYLEPGSVSACIGTYHRLRCQQVHIDQVPAESGDIDRAPVGFRISAQHRFAADAWETLFRQCAVT